MTEPARPLSIRMVLQMYPPEFGGAEVQAQRLSDGLRRRGHDVQVWTIAWRDLPIERLDEHGTPVRSFATRVPARFKTYAFALEAAARMVVERRRFQIAHFHLYSSHALVGAPVARLLGKATLVKFGTFGRYGDAGVGGGGWKGRLRMEYLKRVADRVIYLNEEMRLELERLGFSPDRIVYMPNGLDVSGFTPADPDTRRQARIELGLPDRLTVTFTGQFREQKQLPVLIDAIAGVRASLPDVMLVLAGEGALEATLRARVAALELNDTVRFTGPLSRPDVRRLLQASDLFVLPSASEGISNALLEAMASGLPAVVSDIAGNRDLIDDGVHGLRVPVGDAERLADALITLLSDGPRRNRMGALARARVEEGYSMEAVAERYERLYRSTLVSNPRRTAEMG